MRLKTERNLPYFGSLKFVVFISILIVIAVGTLIIFLYLKFPLERQEMIISLKKQVKQLKQTVPVKPPTTRIIPTKSAADEIPEEIREFINSTCALLSLDTTVSKRIGTGFIVEDPKESTYLFLVTAVHNFLNLVPLFRIRDTIFVDGTRRDTIYAKADKDTIYVQRYRDPVYFLTCCKIKGRDSIKSHIIQVTGAKKSGILKFHPDPGIDLAVYRFKVEPDEKYQFLKTEMLSSTTPITKRTNIYACGFGIGFYNKNLNILEPYCNYGKVDMVVDSINLIIIPDILFLKDYALITIPGWILPGESGGPVILYPYNIQDTNEVKLGGVLVTTIGVDQPSLLGTMIMSRKIKELLDEFKKGNEKTRFIE
jgi:hypothetical protein